MIRRDFSTEPNFGTFDFYSLEDDSSLLRALSPESILNFYCEGENFAVKVGGVTANVPRGYLNRSASMIICSIIIGESELLKGLDSNWKSLMDMCLFMTNTHCLRFPRTLNGLQREEPLSLPSGHPKVST